VLGCGGTLGIPGRPVTAVIADQSQDAEAVYAVLAKLAAELGLGIEQRKNGRMGLVGPDGQRIQAWRENYPYPQRLGKKAYEPAKRRLQMELQKLQRSVKATGGRVLILFEGRDAAGKGGTIRRFTENLNPRGARVVALDKPAEHEQGENYLRRYLPHMPAAGEIVMFDRSWYNRAGVEQVMGFCQPREYARFLAEAPEFERRLVADGIAVIKLWFSITRIEQLSRFVNRQDDPVKRWKLSPVDLASLDKWDEYTRAKEAMFARTDVPEAPWTVIRGNDKKRARLEAMRYVLTLFDYEGKDASIVAQVDPLIIGGVGPLPGLTATESQPVLAPLQRHNPPAALPELAGAGAGAGPALNMDASARPPSELPVPTLPVPALPADCVQRDAGGHPGVERFGAADRDSHGQVALLGDQPGHPPAL
jgi:polyphosphate kinase 2